MMYKYVQRDLLRHEILSHTCVRQENLQWLYYKGNKGCYVINDDLLL